MYKRACRGQILAAILFSVLWQKVSTPHPAAVSGNGNECSADTFSARSNEIRFPINHHYKQ